MTSTYPYSEGQHDAYYEWFDNDNYPVGRW
jgi:hypothetical protein